MKAGCGYAGCDRPQHSRGFCGSHYNAQRAAGLLPSRPLWTVAESGCWLWNRKVRSDGYGVKSVDHRGEVRAHRWVYERQVGPIPDGLELDHLCGTRSCVNPAHLEPVTHTENMRRQWAARKAG